MQPIHKLKFPLQLLLLGAIWLNQSCTAQTGKGHKVDTPDKKVFDVTYYPEDNNLAKAAVAVSDGFIITGQKFGLQKGPDMTRSAIVKLDLRGRIVKEEFVGFTGYANPGKRAMIENVIKAGGQTIFHVGNASGKLWLRMLDNNLNVLRDTVVGNIPVTGITPPRLGRKGNDCYIITEPAGIVMVDSSARQFDYHSLIKAKSSLDLAEFSVADGTFDEAGGLFYIVGSMCTKKEDIMCKEYKQLLLVYDPVSGNIVRETFLNEFYHVKCVKTDNGRLYLAGESLQTRPPKKASRPVSMDWIVSTYSIQGDHLSQFMLDIEDSELVYDLSVRKGKIWLAGECYDEAAINFKALYAVFDLKGTLLDKQLFFSDPTFNRENRFMKIYHTDDDKILLLGKGRGWRVMLLQQ